MIDEIHKLLDALMLRHSRRTVAEALQRGPAEKTELQRLPAEACWKRSTGTSATGRSPTGSRARA